MSWYLTWRYSPADVTRNAGECMVSTRNRLNFSGWWILNELTQNSKALLGTPLQSPQAKPKTQLGQMPCIQALRLVAQQAEGCEGAETYGRYQIKQPAKSREIIKSSRYCTELMSGVQYPGVRCRARRREYPSLSLNSPTWVSH